MKKMWFPGEEEDRKRAEDIWKLEAKILVDLEPITESSQSLHG